VVPESVEKPLDYYANNTAGARTLIETCVRHQVGRILFSPPPPRFMARPKSCRCRKTVPRCQTVPMAAPS